LHYDISYYLLQIYLAINCIHWHALMIIRLGYFILCLVILCTWSHHLGVATGLIIWDSLSLVDGFVVNAGKWLLINFISKLLRISEWYWLFQIHLTMGWWLMVSHDVAIQVMDILKWAVTLLAMLGLIYHFIEFLSQVCWWFSRPFASKTVIVHILWANLLWYLFHCYHVSLDSLLKKWRLSILLGDFFGDLYVGCLKLSACGILMGTFAISWEVNFAIW